MLGVGCVDMGCVMYVVPMGVRMLISVSLNCHNRLQATQSYTKREPQFSIEAVEIETKLVTLGALESLAALCTDDGARPPNICECNGDVRVHVQNGTMVSTQG